VTVLYEHLTDAELAMRVYLAITQPDDALPDDVMELFSWPQPPSEQWHRPESYGPLPDDFPPYPGNAL
jgi:hypothetical protein